MADAVEPTNTEKPKTEEKTPQRKRRLIGIVTRDKMDKTRRVEISRLVKHRRYGKYIKNRTICYVHDENNESRNGDKVEIEECRPLSKTKCWTLLEILVKAPIFKTGEAARQLAEEQAAQEGAEGEFEDTEFEDEEFEEEDEEEEEDEDEE